jgi:hypothetical protein
VIIVEMAVAGASPFVPTRPLRTLLERFRRSAGVPAGVGEELSAELAPVFAVLDQIESEVELMRARSEASASARLQETDEEVETVLAEGQRVAAEARNAELRSALRRTESEADVIARQAEAEAEDTRRLGDERAPALVEAVLDRVREAGV